MNKKSMKMLPLITCRNDEKGGGYIGVTLNISLSLSLTYMNLDLTYAYKELKNIKRK